MADRMFSQTQYTLEKGPVKLFGVVALGASGAVSATGTSTKGFTVTKTASEVGRYTITLQDYYMGLLAANVSLQGAADAAYTASKGIQPFLRGVAVDKTNKVLYVQFVSTAGADAEPEDNAKFYIELTLRNSGAN